MLGNLLDCLDSGIAALVAGSDIEKAHLVGALLVIAHGDFHRIARVAYIDKIDALYHASVVDVQAGNNAFGEPHD